MESGRSTRTPSRLTGTLFLGVALGMVGYYAAFTAGPLVAEDLTGARTWTGLPAAAAILGTSLGATLLSEVMTRRGRRPGLALGWLLGGLGAASAVLAAVVGSFVGLLAAMLVLGCGHGANQLARFAAADPYPPERQGRMLSLVVWAGTIGAILGPVVLGPAARAVVPLGLPELTGGFGVGLVVFAVAALAATAALRPDPASIAWGADRSSPPRRRPLDRTTIVAVVALVTAQFVMVLIMTVTPVHVRGHAHGLTGVGLVISLHVLGMFGLAPAFGWLSDRVGGLLVALLGLVLVAASAWGAATAPPTSLLALTVALLVLGLGWSAAFVASSSLLASVGVAVQGRADAAGWLCAATASVGSGLILARFGYEVVAGTGVVLSLAAAGFVVHTRRRVSADRTERAGTPAST